MTLLPIPPIKQGPEPAQTSNLFRGEPSDLILVQVDELPSNLFPISETRGTPNWGGLGCRLLELARTFFEENPAL